MQLTDSLKLCSSRVFVERGEAEACGPPSPRVSEALPKGGGGVHAWMSHTAATTGRALRHVIFYGGFRLYQIATDALWDGIHKVFHVFTDPN